MSLSLTEIRRMARVNGESIAVTATQRVEQAVAQFVQRNNVSDEERDIFRNELVASLQQQTLDRTKEMLEPATT